MRDETAIPAIDLILLTSIRSLVAKKPCFNEHNQRVRELRDLRKDPATHFDTKRTVKTGDVFTQAMRVASPRHRATLPETSLMDVNAALKRLEADGWIAPSGSDGYRYTHGELAKN